MLKGVDRMVDGGRTAFAAESWREAFDALSRVASTDAELTADDLVALMMAAYLTRVDGWDEWCALAYQRCLDQGALAAAARCGFWLGFGLLNDGEMTRGGGWFTRSQRMLDDAGVDCAERGLLLLLDALTALDAGDPRRALELIDVVCDCGERFACPDVTTLGRLARGQALIEQGARAAGLALLDEAMVAVQAGEVSAPVAGLATCAVLATCQRIDDIGRAVEWTRVLTRWCERHPDLVPYRGQCLVHRAEILRIRGAWIDAAAAAEAACQHLAGQPALGDARYEQGELHRLRGELAAAEAAYREASRASGVTRNRDSRSLRLAQGDVAGARASIGRVVVEAEGPVARGRVLGAVVEIALAADDVAAARAAVDELGSLAAEAGTHLLGAAATALIGRVELAEGDAGAAIVTLRRAWRNWQRIGAPYEAARVRVLVADVCDRLGDADGAAMEREAARWVFHELGALADLARVDPAATPPRTLGALTARETEVLTLVAAGLTNRAIGAELFISDKTVGRHLSNIFAKLGVSSRAVATAWAYEQGLRGTR